MFWFFVEAAYSPEMDDFIENGLNIFFLVEEKDKQYIVILHKDTMKVFQLKSLFSNKKLEVNGYVYTKIYKLK